MSDVTCRELVDFLMQYLEGDLPADQRAAFERHLTLCPPCVRFLKSYNDSIKLSRICCCESDPNKKCEIPEELVRAILASRDKT